MDRPVGNTADVHAECEKWYVLGFLQGEEKSLTRTGTRGTLNEAYLVPKQNAATSPHSSTPCTATRRRLQRLWN